MKRQVSYQWQLRETMAAAGMFAVNDLEPPARPRDQPVVGAGLAFGDPDPRTAVAAGAGRAL